MALVRHGDTQADSHEVARRDVDDRLAGSVVELVPPLHLYPAVAGPDGLFDGHFTNRVVVVDRPSRFSRGERHAE